jgi:PTS system fructose-specific IIB component
VRNEERFNGKEILKVPVAAPIKNAEKVIEDALKLIDQ